MMKEKEPLFQVGENMEDEEKGLFGMDPRYSLQAVNFSPDENKYLSEHYGVTIDEDTK